MTKLALGLISLYQRFLSPYKKFSCAYRLHLGGPSCSAFGYQVISRWGLLAGIQLIQRRFRKCARAHRKAMARLTPGEINLRRLRSQAGHCDLPIGGCDLPSGGCDPGGHDGIFHICGGLGDCAGSFPCDFGSGWPERRHKNDSDSNT